MRGHQSKRVPVRRLLELGRKQRVLAERKNVRTVGPGVGVGLIGKTELPVDRELVDRDRLIDRGDIGLHFGLNVGRHIRSGENGLEIVARHLIGAQMKIKHAELELHPGKIWVVVEHALERADRRLVVAKFGLEFGVAETGVEIVRLDQEALEQEISRDAFVRVSHGRGLSLGGGRRAHHLRERRGGRRSAPRRRRSPQVRRQIAPIRARTGHPMRTRARMGSALRSFSAPTASADPARIL